jgi:iron complex transport system ATP-binding protein
MSDGERQKIMIAKALSQECPIILLDEPTAFLDVVSRIEILSLLRQVSRRQQKTILLSTHDLEQALRMGDALWLLENDRPVVCGAPEDLILDGRFESFFGKEGLEFDPLAGKLSVKNPSAPPIGVEGDPLVCHWVSNALLRNGWKPSPPDPSYINIRCIHPTRLLVIFPQGAQSIAANIREMLLLVES